MRFVLATVIGLAVACAPLRSQEKSLVHKKGSATVTVNDPRPLAQAVITVREEYGWVASYEDPPWQSGDLRDLSPAWWHAAHPGQHGLMEPVGGAFQSTYPEGPHMWSSAGGEPQVLDKIVSDYNASANPGKFVLRAQPDGSYAVIGIATRSDSGGETSVPVYLDTPISLATATRSAQTTLELILSAVSAKTGIEGGRGGLDTMPWMMSENVSIGGNGVPARELLTQLFQAMGLRMGWDLWFSADLHDYELLFRPPELAIPGPFGGEGFFPLNPPQHIGPP